MGLLDNLERGLEKAVRSAFSAGGSRTVEPVEVASALRHEMDDAGLTLSEGHVVSPNDFTVRFSTPDFERARQWGTALAQELCDEVIRYADSQRYTLPGTVRVAFHLDEDLRPGQLEVDSRLDDVAPSSVPQPAPARPAPRRGMPSAPGLPSLEVEGRRHRLEQEDIVVGRSPERADLVLADSSVSRAHARLIRTGAHVTLIDLGSRNGVTVNGRRVDGSVALHHSDRITMGQTTLVFHAADGEERR